MFYLLLCILANASLFFIFKGFSHYKVTTFQAIVVNYFVCVVTGVIFLGGFGFVQHISSAPQWIWIAIGLGGVFICTFYLMALTTQYLGITVSSIANKMSLVIPVLVSLFIMNIASRPLTSINYTGIVLAVAAILLSSIKKRNEVATKTKWSTFMMPVVVFIFGGVIDTTINFVNHHYLTPDTEAVFPIVTFASAFGIGAIALIFQRKKIEMKSVIGGTILGSINFFSIYLLVKSLSAFGNDGAIIYPVVNVGVILTSSLMSVLVFREKLSTINKLGLLIAILAVLLIFYQEIVVQFQA